MKRYILLIITVFFFGCAPLWESAPRWDVEEKAFDRSVGTMVEEEIAKGAYKSKLYSKPVVQKVKVPPMIRGGVYIPEHWEYVIIQPGEYVLKDVDTAEQGIEAAPRADSSRAYEPAAISINIDDIKKKYGIPEKLLPVFLAENDPDVMVAVYDTGVKKAVDDVAVVNLEKAKPLANEQTISSVYIVSDSQVVSIGERTYIFYCGGSFISVLSSSNGRSVSLRVDGTNALVTDSGLIVRPICIRGRIR